MQRTGKSQMIKIAMEAMLDAGKVVALASPEGMLRMKRYGKLTSITPVKEEQPKFIIDDDLYPR